MACTFKMKDIVMFWDVFYIWFSEVKIEVTWCVGVVGDNQEKDLGCMEPTVAATSGASHVYYLGDD